jgi:hypothetical protein
MEDIVTQRVNEFRKSLDLSILAFSKEININQTTLNKQLKDGGCGVQVSTLKQILDTYPNLSAEWLLRGEGSMEKGANAVQMQFGNVLNNTLVQTIDSLNTTIAMLKERLQAYEQPKKVSDAV